MKNVKIKQLMFLCIGSLFILSCSDAEDVTPRTNGQPDGSALNITLTRGELPENMQCVMYVFSKAETSDHFLLQDSIHLNTDYRRVIPYIADDWNDGYYRFLFVALPSQNSGVVVTNHTNNELVRGTDTWQNVRITASNMNSISGDCYFGILDKTNSEISSTRLISGEIKRMVGQMVIDIYRGEDTENAENIKNSEVFSVLDRVDQIEITYSGLSNVMGFDEAGNIQPLSTYSEDLTVTYPIMTQDAFWRVPVTGAADENNPFLTQAATGTLGSVRIKGVFGLPADETVRVKALFRYYDTTAQCGQLVHVHTKYCYEKNDVNMPIRCTLTEHSHSSSCGYKQRNTILNLPAENGTDLLSIMPNMYTVNKAAIRYDRIIDVGISGDYNMAFDWEINE